MESSLVTEKIKQIIKSTDSSAQVILYGSRTRGQARKDVEEIIEPVAVFLSKIDKLIE